MARRIQVAKGSAGYKCAKDHQIRLLPDDVMQQGGGCLIFVRRDLANLSTSNHIIDLNTSFPPDDSQILYEVTALNVVAFFLLPYLTSMSIDDSLEPQSPAANSDVS